MNHAWRSLGFFLIVLTCHGQTANGPASPRVESRVIQTQSSLVLIDVVVRRSGLPIHGLNASQLHIREDGREQRVTSFEEHTSQEATSQQVALGGKRGLAPDTYSDKPPVPGLGAVNVLLLDALNTPVADQMEVRRQMIAYLRGSEPGTRIAIFTLASRLRLVQDLTGDAGLLAKALRNTSAAQALEALGGQTAPALDHDMQTMSDDMTAMGASPNAIGSLQQFAADNAAFQTDMRVRLTLDAMDEISRYLSGVPGRKNLIWFSGSFPLSLAPDKTLTSSFSAARNYSEGLRETSQLLASARVAVYPVDARGLLTSPIASAEYTAASTAPPAQQSRARGGRRGASTIGAPTANGTPGGAGMGREDAKFLQQTNAEHASMEQIAEDTGGRVFKNTNGLKEAVAQAVSEGGSYYTIGYKPVTRKTDGSFHRLQVKVDGGDYDLSYRRGYYADDAQAHRAKSSNSLIAAAALPGILTASEVLFTVRVLQADDPRLKGDVAPKEPAGEAASALKAPAHKYVIDFAVNPSGLNLTVEVAGKRRAQLEFLAMDYDKSGRQLNYSDRGYAFVLTPEQYYSALNGGIPCRLVLDVPRGETTLRLAVRDLMADRIGSLEVPLK